MHTPSLLKQIASDKSNHQHLDEDGRGIFIAAIVA